MKNLIVKISFIIAIICAASIVSNAQSNDKFTYRDLLNQQKIEREELKLIHRETLDKIILRQKEEIELVRGNSGPTMTVMAEQREEREKIVQLQKEEREKQMQIQADERKTFKP